MRARDCSPGYREEFFSETEHILIRCGGSSRRRAGSRRIGAEGSRPFAMPRRRRLATCRLLVKPLEPLILICAPCGGSHLSHPKIIGVAPTEVVFSETTFPVWGILGNAGLKIVHLHHVLVL